MGNVIIKDFYHNFKKHLITFTAKNNGQRVKFSIQGINGGYDDEHYLINNLRQSYLEDTGDLSKLLIDHWDSEDIERLCLFIEACGEMVYEGWVL